jgi:serine/threonine protein kinase
MFSDYYESGELASLAENHQLSESDCRFYAAQMVLAIEAIHAVSYYHYFNI